MMPFSLFLSLKYLKPKRSFISVVTGISIAGVFLGVAILVIVLSVMTGFSEMWREKILSFKPHLTVESAFGSIRNEEGICRRIEAVDGITGAAPALETIALIRNDERVAAPFVVGIDPDRAGNVSRVPYHITAGSFSLETDEAVLGCDLAERMNLETGDTFLVYSARNVTANDEFHLPEELTVAGIFDLGMHNFDAGFVLVPLAKARDMVGIESGAGKIYVMTEDAFQFAAFRSRLVNVLPAEYYVSTWKDIDQLLFKAVSHEKTMMFILLVFITIVAIFCVTNTLIVITVQKTHEIGLLKALGFRRSRIIAAFVLHGLIQCVIGILLGIGAGVLIGENLGSITEWLGSMNIQTFPKEIYGLDEIPWVFSAKDVLTVSITVLAACVAASIMPALRAGRLSPAEALRQE
ncbi:MAG: ABC transporter permease [Kiritimatiellia bacterium]